MDGEIQRVQLLLQQDRAAMALDEVRAYLAKHPNDLDGMYCEALALLNLVRIGEAEEAAGRLLAAHPQSWAGHSLLADVAMERKQWRRAMDHVRAALECDPERATLQAMAATIELQRQLPGRAERLARAGLKLDPKDARSGRALVAALAMQGDRLEEAQAEVLRQLQERPEDPFLHRMLGALAQAKDRPREAARHFRESLRLNPHQAGVAREHARLTDRRSKSFRLVDRHGNPIPINLATALCFAFLAICAWALARVFMQ